MTAEVLCAISHQLAGPSVPVSIMSTKLALQLD